METFPKFATTRMVTNDGVEVEVGDFWDAFNKASIIVILKKYACSIRDHIIEVVMRFQIEPNLAKRIQIRKPIM
jgi:hypothetical protein